MYELRVFHERGSYSIGFQPTLALAQLTMRVWAGVNNKVDWLDDYTLVDSDGYTIKAIQM